MKARTKAHDFLETGVTGSEIAVLLGLSKRRVSQLAAAGIIKKLGRDSYSPELGDYIEYRVALARERRDKTLHSSDFELERLRRLRRQNERADEDLVARAEVEHTIVIIAASIIKGICAIPEKSGVVGLAFERATVACERLAMGIQARSDQSIQKLAVGQEIFDMYGI